MSYRQQLIQRLRVPPLPNYLKEEHERNRRERKRIMREEEERKLERKKKREREREKEREREREEEEMNARVSGSGGDQRCEMTGERRKRKRAGDDDDQDTWNAKRICMDVPIKGKAKRVRSLHKMAAYTFIPFFNNLPDGPAQDVPEKFNQWFREIISYEQLQNMEIERKRLYERTRS